MRTNYLRWMAAVLLASLLAAGGCGSCDEEAGGKGTDNTQQPDAAQCADDDGDGSFAGGGCDGAELDCDDSDASAHPGADEICGDGLDNNCDGQVDEDCASCESGQTRVCGTDEGECTSGTQSCVDGVWGECEGEVRAQPELCDGLDNDCDGDVDEDPEQSLCDDGIKCNGVEVCDAGECAPGEPVDCSHLDDSCYEGTCQEKDGSCAQVVLADGTSCEDGNFCTIGGTCNQGVCESEARDCSAAGDQCNEGVCDAQAEACVPRPIADGTSCDDGEFCTVDDACQAGACTGAARDCSGEDDQCNVGVCDEQADSCVPDPVADDTPCDDGLYCNTGETCQQGQCTGGAQRQCGAAGGSCRTGVCDEQADSCTGDPVPDGTACDTGDFCTVNDQCSAGTCVAGSPRDCSAAGDQCNDGVCDEANNRCEPSAKPDGTTCDDGTFCTVSDACTAGSCGGQTRDCSAAGDQCNSGVCDEQAGSCVAQPVSDGTSCDDGTFCTVSDTCTAGTCDGSARACGWAGDQCNDGVCDEDAGSCVAEPVTDGTSCDDGEYCTVTDACTAGSCGGASRDCSGAGDQCNDGVCDEQADSCVPQPVSDGTSCDDGAFCTVNDSCTSGTCGGSAMDCSAYDDQCNVGVCDENSDTCYAEPVADGTSCDDGVFCTVNDSCTAGTCGGSTMDCSAYDDQCNVGMCDEANQTCYAEPVSDGTSCDDGEFCTVNDSCTSGTCGGSAMDCSGLDDQCNTGVCDEQADSCVPEPVADGTSCDDGTFCTVSDTCTSGTCGGSAMDCSAYDDQCNVGMCDEANQTCYAEPVSDGTSCDDGVFCTVNDSCTAGTCGGSAMDCSAYDDQCNVGMCDEANQTCYAEPVSDGTSCDDGEFCTVNDSCTSGTCGGSAMDCSGLDDQCNTGVCDEQADSCVPEPVSDGTSCDDGTFCTVSDTCTSGTCGGSAMDCSAYDDQCNTGTCDEANDICFADPVADGTSCDDGAFCTVSDECTSGTCGGAPMDCSAFDDQCNTGQCDEANDTCYADPAVDGTLCDDGAYCTVNDECTSGVCDGSSRDCSSAGDQCNTGACDEANDLCFADPVADGTLCDDGAYCTVSDTCTSGICKGSSRDCSGWGDQCNTGRCDEANQTCYADPVTDGTSCDDGVYCTENDACTSGACDGSPRDCSAYDDQCNTGQCDEANQTCYADPVSDGTLCDDNLYCTVSDECTSGTCDGQARDCSGVAVGDPCAYGVCNESLDTCEKQYQSGCCDTSVDNDLDGSNQCDDCDDTNGSVHPNASEFCNGVDDDCDGLIDEDFDNDGDGYATCTDDPALRDCDDNDANVSPGLPEDCGGNNQGNGVDDNCNGYVDEGCDPCTTSDVDGDGYSECDGDCDDNDASMYPGADEQCDGKDNDCNTFTTSNCDVSEPCNWSGDQDECFEDMLCACILDNSGSCNGDYRCTPYCNWSETGPVGDGCGSDQTCMYDLLRSANIHGCGITTDIPGSKGGGEACADDSECRSLNCDRICRGPGCNQDYCQDYCSGDDYCGSNAVCQLQRTSSQIDGRCWPAGGPLLGSTPVGQSCSGDTDCDHGMCLNDPNDGSVYCTEACCKDSDCPSGYSCSTRGEQIDTSYVYPDPDQISCTTDSDCTGDGGICYNNECAWRLVETSPMCIKDVSGQGSRVAGQACTQNSDCASNFCESSLGICLSTCCNDTTCPTGLTCESQIVQTNTDRVSRARVCINVSTDSVLRYD